MKKKALKKDFRTEVRKSLNRFLSIFFIVAMGVAFYSGIQAAAPDMKITGDSYFDDSSLMDLRVVSTLGITEDDLEALREIEGVSYVEGTYQEDVFSGEGENRSVLRVESLPESVNHPSAEEGELPQKPGDCFLDSAYALENGYKVGDTLEISFSGDEEDSQLVRDTFMVCGVGNSPSYIAFERGSTTLGNGEVSGFAYVLPEDFDTEVYSMAYVLVDGARELMAYTDEYDDAVETVSDRIEEIQDVRCEIRYREVMEEAQSELDEGKQELADGKKELEDAKQKLADAESEAESELSEAESELIEGESELESGKQELEDAKQEAANAEKELTDGEEELAEKEAELNDGIAQLADARKTLADGETSWKSGQDQYREESEKAQKELAAAQKEIDDGRTELENGRKEYKASKKQLKEGKQAYDAGVKQIEKAQSEYDAGMEQLAQGQAQYDAGAAELAKSQEQYDAGAEQLAQGQTQYDAGVAELAQAQAQYDAGMAALAEYEAGKKALEELNQNIEGLKTAISGGESQLAGLKEQLGVLQSLGGDSAQGMAEDGDNQEGNPPGESESSGESKTPLPEDHSQEIAQLEAQIAGLEAELAAYRETLAPLEEQYLAGKAALDAREQEISALSAQLASAKEQLDAGYAELEASKKVLDETSAQLAGAKAQLDAGYAQLAASKQELDTGRAELAEAKKQIKSGRKELAANKKQITQGEKELKAAKKQLKAAGKELDAGQAEVDAGYKELADAKAELDKARKELDDGWAEWNSSQAAVLDGQRQIEDAKRELADGWQELADAKQEIADGEKEIEENEQKLADGWKDYEEGKQTAEEEIADAKQEIKDAEQEIADAEKEIADGEEEIGKIKVPDWYIYNRDALPENTGYGENAERMSNIGEVFPALFFLVAALISLTTMTRMVEEERTQIGTLKALGYSKGAIASKYLKYAFYATLGGSVVGILFGEKVFPWVIITAYGIMYQHLPAVLVPYNWDFGLAAAAVAMVCTLAATFSACRRELRAVPAELMRPPAPKQGKRVLLEYLPFLWKPLSFSWKSTVRNLLRYKKRFLMTVIGIGGCMGLLLVGYGLRDSIMDVAILQFDELQHYEAMLILDTEEDEEEQQKVIQAVEEDDRLAFSSLSYMQKVDVKPEHEQKNQKEWSAYLQVVKSREDLDSLFTFRDRETKEPYALDDTGAIVTEKIAAEFELEPGDHILVEDEDNGMISIPVAQVCENYLSHYIYLTPELYEKVFGKEPEYNSILMIAGEDHQEDLQKIGAGLLEYDAALNISYTYALADQLNNMLNALDIVMIVLIVSAGMLAFVVLYNLNNININERKRELATLKVLGFYDGEVGAYVYRENVILTLVGAFLGIFIGKFLHSFVILTVEVDSCMFGRNIKPMSYLYGVLYTFAFSIIVNAVMYFKLKKIDMVESLKSIE